MRAKAVVVFDPSGVPIHNAIAILNGQYSPLTNTDGYALFSVGFAAGPTSIIVIANGFKSYVQAVTLSNEDQNILIGQPTSDPNNISLPPLSFKKPSRDSIINVKANFCNLYDAQNIPILEGFILTLISEDPIRAEDWVKILKANGSTHIVITLSGDYTENLGWAVRYPIIGRDWTKDLLGFSQCLDWLIARNLIPIVKLAMDGQAYDPNGLTYGWRWGMDNIPNILSSLSKYWDSCLWSTGFDGCFPNWSPEQTVQALRMMRSVMGDAGNIDTEFASTGSISYSHMGNGAADWSDDKLGILDCFSLELQTFPAQADGIAQTATRLLGPAARNTPTTPYYLNNNKTRTICMFETVAYWFSHGQTTDYKTAANLAKYYGFTSFGNGLPD